MTHNLSKNYRNANGAGDVKMKSDMLMSELAKLIVNRPARVVELLNEFASAGIKGIPGTKRLSKLVSGAMNKSKAFAKAIVKEMLVQPVRSADGDKSPSYGDILGNAADLVNGFGNIFGGSKKAKAEADKAKYEAEKALAEKANAVSSAGNTGPQKSNMKYLLIVPLAIGAAVGLVYAFKS